MWLIHVNRAAVRLNVSFGVVYESKVILICFFVIFWFFSCAHKKLVK